MSKQQSQPPEFSPDDRDFKVGETVFFVSNEYSFNANTFFAVYEGTFKRVYQRNSFNNLYHAITYRNRENIRCLSHICDMDCFRGRMPANKRRKSLLQKKLDDFYSIKKRILSDGVDNHKDLVDNQMKIHTLMRTIESLENE